MATKLPCPTSVKKRKNLSNAAFECLFTTSTMSPLEMAINRIAPPSINRGKWYNKTIGSFCGIYLKYLSLLLFNPFKVPDKCHFKGFIFPIFQSMYVLKLDAFPPLTFFSSPKIKNHGLVTFIFVASIASHRAGKGPSCFLNIPLLQHTSVHHFAGFLGH